MFFTHLAIYMCVYGYGFMSFYWQRSQQKQGKIHFKKHFSPILSLFFSHISSIKSPVGSTSLDEERINTKKAASAPPKFGAT